MWERIDHRLKLDVGVVAGLIAAVLSVIAIDRLRPDREPNALEPGASASHSILAPKSIYALRTEAKREEWLAGLGGTPRSEAAVAAGLDWLARHQASDGCWRDRFLGPGPESVCQKESPCRGQGTDFPFAQTGLALLAFQAGGHFDFNDHPHSARVRRGLDWLVFHQAADGSLCSEEGSYQQFMYEHGIATFALCEACAVARALERTPDPRYLEAARRAVAFIEKVQHDDGGWRYTKSPVETSDSSVTGWQVLALKTAREAGIPVSADCLRKLGAFFASRETGKNGRTAYLDHSVNTDATTGVGILFHLFLLEQPHSELVQQAVSYLAGMAEKEWGKTRGRPVLPDYYLWYNCTLAMYLADGPKGDDWTRWNDVVRDVVVSLQEKPNSDCVRGSWPPLDRWSSGGGRIYTTALAVLTLEVYYRYAHVPK